MKNFKYQIESFIKSKAESLATFVSNIWHIPAIHSLNNQQNFRGSHVTIDI